MIEKVKTFFSGKHSFVKKSLALTMAGILVASQVPRQIQQTQAAGENAHGGGMFTGQSGTGSGTVSLSQTPLLRVAGSIDTVDEWYAGYEGGYTPNMTSIGFMVGGSNATYKVNNVSYVNSAEGHVLVSNHPYTSFTADGYNTSNATLKTLLADLYTLFTKNGNYDGDLPKYIGSGLTSTMSTVVLKEFWLSRGVDSERVEQLVVQNTGLITTVDRDKLDETQLRQVDLVGATIATVLQLISEESGVVWNSHNLSWNDLIGLFTGDNNKYHFNIGFENLFFQLESGLSAADGAYVNPRHYFTYISGQSASSPWLSRNTMASFQTWSGFSWASNMRNTAYFPETLRGSGNAAMHREMIRQLFETDGSLFLGGAARRIIYFRTGMYVDDPDTGMKTTLRLPNYMDGLDSNISPSDHPGYEDPSQAIWNLYVISNTVATTTTPIIGTGTHQLHSEPETIYAEVNETVTANQYIDFKQNDTSITEILKSFQSAYDEAIIEPGKDASIIFTNILYKTDKTGVDEGTYYEFNHKNEYEPTEYNGDKPTGVRDTNMFLPFSGGASTGSSTGSDTSTDSDTPLDHTNSGDSPSSETDTETDTSPDSDDSSESSGATVGYVSGSPTGGGAGAGPKLEADKEANAIEIPIAMGGERLEWDTVAELLSEYLANLPSEWYVGTTENKSGFSYGPRNWTYASEAELHWVPQGFNITTSALQVIDLSTSITNHKDFYFYDFLLLYFCISTFVISILYCSH